jgi:hypothetical protein
MSGVALVQFSSLNLKKLLPLGRQALDRNLAAGADGCSYEPPLHHMLCVAAIKSEETRCGPHSVKPYLNLFHAGFVIGADERDCADILSAAGLPSIMTECVERGINMIFVSGTLAQWRDAMIRGSTKEVSKETRHTFNLIYTEFKNVGVSGIFDLTTRDHPRDQTFLLEFHQ